MSQQSHRNFFEDITIRVCAGFLSRFAVFVAFILASILFTNISIAQIKPQIKDWQLLGLADALADPDPKVRQEARLKFASYRLPPEFPKKYNWIASEIALLLEDDEEGVRISAAISICAMGAAAEPFAFKLAHLLVDTDPGTRAIVIRAMASSKQVVALVAPKLAELLTVGDPNVKEAALEAFCSFGAQSSMYTSNIVHLLSDRHPAVRLAAARAIGAMEGSTDHVMPTLFELLTDNDSKTRYAAVDALRQMTHSRSNATKISGLLTHPDKDVRRATLRVLESMKNMAIHLSDEISRLLDDKEPIVRRAAAKALFSIVSSTADEKVIVTQLLEHKDLVVKSEATKWFGLLGNRRIHYAHILSKNLNEQDIQLKLHSVRAIGAMGDLAKSYAPEIEKLLDAENAQLRSAAARSLTNCGTVTSASKLKLVSLIGHESSIARMSAAEAIGSLIQNDLQVELQILKFFGDKRAGVRVAALRAIALMGRNGSEYAAQVAEMLQDEESVVIIHAIRALGSMGDEAIRFGPLIASLLEHNDSSVRYEARDIWASLDATENVVAQVIQLLENEDRNVRQIAVSSLGTMGEKVTPYAEKISSLLSDPDSRVRYTTAIALGKLGESARHVAPQIAMMLSDNDRYVRNHAQRALEEMGPHDIQVIAELLNSASKFADRNAQLKTLAYILASGITIGDSDVDAKELIALLAIRERKTDSFEIEPSNIEFNRMLARLNALRFMWESTRSQHFSLRNDIGCCVEKYVLEPNRDWSVLHIDLLNEWKKKLESHDLGNFSNGIDAQLAAISREASIRRTIFRTGSVFLLHAIIWIFLIGLYPRSPKIQTIFFWNPWVRRLLGFGYVGILLVYIPYLRSRLFSPFRQLLKADAALIEFNELTYFSEMRVRKNREDPIAIDEAIPFVKSRLILEGESGLGKSMFVRHLVNRSKRLIVYLTSTDCSEGVIEAIQNKLPEGLTEDNRFLKSLIYCGAIDLVIDGLNEVDPNVRSLIGNFLKKNTYGNVIVTTQPVGWKPPNAAQKFVLQPLDRKEIRRFLLSRPELKKHTKRCENFLETEFTKEQSEESILALSNPMDLTVVARLLVKNKKPELFRLQEQQYDVMSEEFQYLHVGQEFQLSRFSKIVYEMRSKGRTTGPIPKDGFNAELNTMNSFKMITGRHEENSDSVDWYFRHEKIAEFFVIRHFLMQEKLWPKHVDDARFRGIYFGLARALPFDMAKKKLGKQIIKKHAKKTGDPLSLWYPFRDILDGREEA